jgi:hypothetical protein
VKSVLWVLFLAALTVVLLWLVFEFERAWRALCDAC